MPNNNAGNIAHCINIEMEMLMVLAYLRQNYIKRMLIVDYHCFNFSDSELPSLLSRGEATVQTEHGSNPPPSPATDARDCSSDTDGQSHIDAPSHSPSRVHSPLPNRTDPRQIQDYDDDDFLEVMCNDDMDLL